MKERSVGNFKTRGERRVTKGRSSSRAMLQE